MAKDQFAAKSKNSLPITQRVYRSVVKNAASFNIDN